MNEAQEQARREVLDWLHGTGSTLVLVILAALAVMFLLVGTGLL